MVAQEVVGFVCGRLDEVFAALGEFEADGRKLVGSHSEVGHKQLLSVSPTPEGG